MSRAFSVDYLPTLVSSRLGGHGVRGVDIEIAEVHSDVRTEHMAPHEIHTANAVLRFEMVSARSNVRRSQVQIHYLRNDDEQPTYGRVAEILSFNKDVRRLFNVSTGDLRRYEETLSKGYIAGYHGARAMERDDMRGVPLVRAVVRHTLRRDPVEIDPFFNALWNLGIRPLIYLG